jgi:hypothetical protein
MACLSETVVSTYNSARHYYPQDGDSIFLRNVGIYLQVHTTLPPKRWRQYISPKRWYLPASPHGVTTHKMETVCFSETLVPTYKSTRRYNPEHGDSVFLRNVGIYLQVYTALLHRSQTATSSPPCEAQIPSAFIVSNGRTFLQNTKEKWVNLFSSNWIRISPNFTSTNINSVPLLWG